MLTPLYYLLVPLLLIALVAYRRQPSILMWLMSVLAFGSAIAFLYATARWEMLSIYARPVFPILFVIAVIIGFRRIRKPEKPPKKLAIIMGVGISIVLVIFFSGMNWFSFKGYAKPDVTIDVASPFHEGKMIVLHGGRSPFTNGHYHVKPQNHALDIVGLNSLGMRSAFLGNSSSLEDYVIFGQEVHSPVTGRVLLAVDEFEDMIPPATDTEHLAGNHVLIESEGVEFLLAHLKKGSIRVKPGDLVTPDVLLGQVGNTGNTSEPHLHIHAEKGGEPNTILNGKAVAFTIDGRFLVRGDVIEGAE